MLLLGSERKPSQFPEGSRSRAAKRVNWKEIHKEGLGLVWLLLCCVNIYQRTITGQWDPQKTSLHSAVSNVTFINSPDTQTTWGWQTRGSPNHTRTSQRLSLAAGTEGWQDSHSETTKLTPNPWQRPRSHVLPGRPRPAPAGPEPSPSSTCYCGYTVIGLNPNNKWFGHVHVADLDSNPLARSLMPGTPPNSLPFGFLTSFIRMSPFSQACYNYRKRADTPSPWRSGRPGGSWSHNVLELLFVAWLLSRGCKRSSCISDAAGSEAAWRRGDCGRLGGLCSNECGPIPKHTHCAGQTRRRGCCSAVFQPRGRWHCTRSSW